nr:calcium-binding protein [Acinetobacter harbinensis]
MIVKYSDTDQINVESFFDSNGTTAYRIDQIVFANGTVWDVAYIKNQVLVPSVSNDIIQGYSSNDVLAGLVGNDSIYGNAGNDTLTGGVGNDLLDGGSGSDAYVFGLGDGVDVIRSYDADTNKLDKVVFDEGITPESVILKRVGNDLIVKYSDTDQINVESFFDANGATAYRIDQIEFHNGIVWNLEDIKTKVLGATDSNDEIRGYASNDQLSGLAGNDSIYGNDGNDTLIGGVGDDSLNGGAGNDTYIFARNFGHDFIDNYDSTKNRLDVIQFTDGLIQSDFIYRRNNDDLIIKTLDGQNSITVNYYFNDDANGNYRTDQIKFSDNTVLDVEAVKALVLIGTDASEIFRAYATGSEISAGAGGDQLYGNIGNDRLDGGSGADQLFGYNGNDTLIGGVGDDSLNGGAGNDTYIFARNFGHDFIDNYDSTKNRLDVIQFTDGLIQSDFIYRRNNDDLIIKTLDGQNSITVNYYFNDDANGNYRTDQIKFSDKTVLDVEAVKALVLLGTDASEIFRAYVTGSEISAGAGDDFLYGNIGNDRLDGGDGLDKLYGNEGNDHLEGGAGVDELYGGAGNDTYIFAPNFGHDSIDNYDYSTNRQDVIQFTGGLIQSNFTYRRENDDLIIKTLDGQNSITVNYYFNNDAAGSYRIDQIKFSDSTVLDVEAVKALVLLGTDASEIFRAYATGSEISAGAGDDFLYGNIDNDRLDGGDGLDKLYGNEGNDHLEGGAGVDELYGENGNDLLKGDAGADLLDAGNGDDQLYGGLDNDTLLGGSGDDQLEGGDGDDLLNGGDGNDTYIFARNFGHDIIDNYDYSTNRQDVIQFTDGLIQSDFTYRRNNDDLIINTLDSQNSIIVRNYFNNDVAGSYQIDQVKFSDNTVLDIDAVKALVLIGTDASEIFRAYATGSEIFSGAGDDILYGKIGDDSFYGGDGLDKLYGNDGNDHLEGGKGADELYGENGNDLLKGDAGADLLDAGNGDDQLYGGLDNDTLLGGSGDDQLEGGDGDDSLDGGLGNDILNGSQGNDLLKGGDGNDIYQFNLGWGNDQIQNEYKNTTDIDKIEFIGVNSADLVVRKVGQDMVITHRVTGDQLTIQSQFAQYGYSKAIQFIHFEDGTQWDLDDFNVQAVKGTELNDVIEGTTDHDVIHAGEGDDLITGTTIDPQNTEIQYFVYGEAGNDTINASGYLDGGAGNDEINGQGHLLGGDGDDILTGVGVLEGQNGNDILSGEGALFGGDGEDQLTLTNLGNDAGQLIGGTGNDTLIVDINRRIFVDENNQSEFVQDEDGYHIIQDTELTESQRAVYIEGGQGNDTIYGSFGDEVYLFNLGDGQDILIERLAGQNYTNIAVSFDVLRFGENITTTDISLHRYGADLVVKHANKSDQITIQNYFNGGHYKINEIQFADQTIWNNAYLENHVTYHGTNSIDEVWGYRASNEVFEMDAGDDKVYAGAGDDIIYGQSGTDTLWGQAGNDTLYGGTGADYLEGSEGNDTLFGDDDNDTLYGGAGNDVLAGGNGNDILSGGTGTDVLNGGAGDDKYYYNLTDGADVINQTGGGTDVLWLMDNGITRNRISFNKEGNDLVVIIDQNQKQSVRVVDHFLGGEKAISSVNANGQVPILAKDIEGIIKAQAYGGLYDTVLEGTAGSETIYGTSGNDLIQGLDGNDTIWAQAGNDRLEGGAGNDTLDGGDGNDSISGGIGNDILIGRAGIDTLDGGAGDDKYYYYLTDGADVINQTGGGTDVIWLMDSGITEDRIKFTKETNDLLITIDNNANQTIRVKDHFLGGEKAIASVQPNGGYAITAAQIANKVNGTGGTTIDPAGDTTYNYTSGALIINEVSGTDKVVFATGTTLSQISSNLTKTGNDLLIKVKGSTANTVTVKNFFLAGNYLVETFQVATGEKLTAAQIFTAYGLTLPGTGVNAAGDTTYNYTSGDLTITEVSGTDKVVFASSITYSQVGNNITKSGNDLILKVNGSTTNKVTVKDFFLAGDKLVETFQFATGEQLTASDIFGAYGLTLPSTGGGTINATGDTTYNYTSGDLTITEVSGTDKVVFASGITYSQVGNNLTKSGNDLILKVNGSTTNKVTVKNFFLAGDNLVETFKFTTGEEITAADIFGAFGLTPPHTGGGETGSSEVVGDTTYVYTTGALTITEVSGTDKVIFKNGITFNQIGQYLNKSGNDLVLKLDGSNTNKVTVKDFFLGGDKIVETFSFETGGSLTASQIFGAFGLTMPAAVPAASRMAAPAMLVEDSIAVSDEIDYHGNTVHKYSTGILQVTEKSGVDAFGLERPVNAEEIVDNMIIGEDRSDDVFYADAYVQELFFTGTGNDTIILSQLSNSSNTTQIVKPDYWANFNVQEGDQIDVSKLLDGVITQENSNIYLDVKCDAGVKTNTLSLKMDSLSSDLLVFTSQSTATSLQELLDNQTFLY